MIVFCPLKNGGYRTNEQFLNLSNNIIANGLENPIEISVDKNGKKELYNGNHRLLVAEKLWLKKIPIKYIDNIENFVNTSYNSHINSYIEGEDNGSIPRITKFKRGNDKDKYNVRTSINDSKQSNIKRGISGDDGLFDALPGYNDRTSSTSALEKNDIPKKPKEELNDTSFFVDPSSQQYDDLIKTNYIIF